MDSDVRERLVKLFYETPKAQEIYVSLRKKRKAAEQAENEASFIFIEKKSRKELCTNMLGKSEKDQDVSSNKEQNDFKGSVCSCDDESESRISLDEHTVNDDGQGTLLSESVSKFSQVFQNLEKCNYSISQEHQKSEIVNWSLRIVNDGDVIVEGKRSSDAPGMFWRTSVIRERVSTNVVQSRKGTLYFLLGEINETDMTEKNFSDEIIEIFRYGFPPNWRDILTSDRLKKLRLSNAEQTVVKASDDASKRTLNWEDDTAHCAMDEKIFEQEESQKFMKKSKSNVQSLKSTVDQNVASKNTESSCTKIDKKSDTKSDKNRLKSNREAKKKVKKSASVPRKRALSAGSNWTLNGSALNDTQEIEVQRSRSGRLICPVLDFWRGQRITTSPGGDGEISIIKSNLEEDLRLTLVEANKNKSGSLQNPTVSSTATTGPSSDTEWTVGSATSRTSTTATSNSRVNYEEKQKNKTEVVRRKSYNMRSDSHLSNNATVDSGQQTNKNDVERNSHSKKRTTTRKGRSKNRSKNGELSASESSQTEQDISLKTSAEKTLLRISKTSNSRHEGEESASESGAIKRISRKGERLSSSEIPKDVAKSRRSPRKRASKSKIKDFDHQTAKKSNKEPLKRPIKDDTIFRSINKAKIDPKISGNTKMTDVPTKSAIVLDQNVSDTDISVEKVEQTRKNKRGRRATAVVNEKMLRSCSKRSRYGDEKGDRTLSSDEPARVDSKKSGEVTLTKRMKAIVDDISDAEVKLIKVMPSISIHQTNSIKENSDELQVISSKKSKVERKKLTLKKGTLARKRELREMLEQQDKGYEDDAFEGTPFRHQKIVKKVTLSPVSIVDSSDIPEDFNENDHKTPSSKTPMNRLRPAGPISAEKSDIMTPGLLNSVKMKNLDRYVNRLKKQKTRNVRKKVDTHTPLKASSYNIHQDLKYSFNVQESTTLSDDGDEVDNYFSSENE